MSTGSAHSDRSTPAQRRSIAQPLALLYRPVQFVGFWTAILLPFVTFPMVATGVAGEHLVPFAALVVANLVALVLGRGYKAD
jgi:hypothetical protein